MLKRKRTFIESEQIPGVTKLMDLLFFDSWQTTTRALILALFDGTRVFCMLIFLQFFITWLSVRLKSVRKFVTSPSVLLLYRGELIDEIRKRERITMENLLAAARREGISQLKDIDAIVLDTTGDITIISEQKELAARLCKM